MLRDFGVTAALRGNAVSLNRLLTQHIIATDEAPNFGSSLFRVGGLTDTPSDALRLKPVAGVPILQLELRLGSLETATDQ